ncbi:tumor suppressor candidate 4 [Trichinella spiralis]|uniref:tumor suppressor candidate 4 n=1 Tax=Trichinella spiralis TaxID=6334 RepID=UPI0001EFCDF4|nr:tumor suppressor candidate 4 [Trichinella spiralis]
MLASLAPSSPNCDVPPLLGIFYAKFDSHLGPRILCQVPPDKQFIERDVFDTVSSFIITKSKLVDQLVKVDLADVKIIGYPKAIPGNQYDRNAYIFNVCFVVANTKTNDRDYVYEPLVEKLAKSLEILERHANEAFQRAERDRMFVDNSGRPLPSPPGFARPPTVGAGGQRFDGACGLHQSGQAVGELFGSSSATSASTDQRFRFGSQTEQRRQMSDRRGRGWRRFVRADSPIQEVLHGHTPNWHPLPGQSAAAGFVPHGKIERLRNAQVFRRVPSAQLVETVADDARVELYLYAQKLPCSRREIDPICPVERQITAYPILLANCNPKFDGSVSRIDCQQLDGGKSIEELSVNANVHCLRVEKVFEESPHGQEYLGVGHFYMFIFFLICFILIIPTTTTTAWNLLPIRIALLAERDR